MATTIVNGARVTEIPLDTSVTNEQLERRAAAAPKALRWVEDVAPGYEIRKFKSFRGMEGLGFDLDLHRGGRRVATVLDEGCGGSLRFDFSGEDERARLTETMRAYKASLSDAKRAETFVEHDPGYKWADNADLEMFMAVVVTAFEEVRRFRRKCKTQTVVQVGDKIGSDQFLSFRKPFSPAVKAYILSKYPGQRVSFLNEELARP